MLVHSLGVTGGMNIVHGIDLFFMETEYVAVTSVNHFHHTPSKHCELHVSFVNSAMSQQHSYKIGS